MCRSAIAVIKKGEGTNSARYSDEKEPIRVILVSSWKKEKNYNLGL